MSSTKSAGYTDRLANNRRPDATVKVQRFSAQIPKEKMMQFKSHFPPFLFCFLYSFRLVLAGAVVGKDLRTVKTLMEEKPTIHAVELHFRLGGVSPNYIHSFSPHPPSLCVTLLCSLLSPHLYILLLLQTVSAVENVNDRAGN
jgi:hypothetical protein